MAKVAFSKLNIKKVNDEVKTIQFNDIDIEVKQYLPIQDKLTIIGNAINNAADGNKFPNHIKIEMFLILEMIYAYSNITFTDKQKEDISKLYDILISSGLKDAIFLAIPIEEQNLLLSKCDETVYGIYGQMNSIYGIMENIAQDYANVGTEAADIEQKIANPNNLTFLRDVMNKLG